MTQLVVKRNGTKLPALVDDFFNTRSFLPNVFDFDSDFFDMNGGSLLVPDANIIENEKDYKIDLAAPGLEKKDFKVEILDGVLNISAEKEEEKKEEGKNFRRREFSYNSFKRAFTLPDNLMNDKIDAKYENGILHLTFPKKEVTVSKPAKQIKVA